jgi:hypothetical protein
MTDNENNNLEETVKRLNDASQVSRHNKDAAEYLEYLKSLEENK